MTAGTMLALLLLAAAPVDATFLLELDGVPAATLHVLERPSSFDYRVTRFLEEGDAVFSRTFPLGGTSPAPEVQALLHLPAVGCRDVLEERTGALEPLCVTVVDDGAASGTVGADSFRARYGSDGALDSISVATVTWVRVHGVVSRPAVVAAPLAEGVAVTAGPGPVHLTPAVEGARTVTVKPVGEKGSVGRTRCLPLARAYARRTGGTVVLGLLVDAQRAWPHAWVRTAKGDVDPSFLPGETHGYLELPTSVAGRTYLGLLDGSLRPTRVR
jgi:hypothetical protein